MTKPLVRCRCGHCILRSEVLRTELWERGRDYVYVRFRCRRCKRIGESFVPAEAWDWSLLDPPRSEFTSEERDAFVDLPPISADDIALLHQALDGMQTLDRTSLVTDPNAGVIFPLPRSERRRASERAASERSEHRDDEHPRSGHDLKGDFKGDRPDASEGRSHG